MDNLTRKQLATRMITFLKSKLNCQNVVEFTSRYRQSTNPEMASQGLYLTKNYLKIENHKVTFKIIRGTKSKLETWLETQVPIMDFMSETNNAGQEYFAYIYGVLTCNWQSESDNTHIYIYSEYFGDNFRGFIAAIKHASEWYDVVFQLVMINQFLAEKGYASGEVDDYSYQIIRQKKTKYEIAGENLTIMHKCQLVMTGEMPPKLDADATSKMMIIRSVTSYLAANPGATTVAPSDRIKELMRRLVDKPDTYASLLVEYYGQNLPVEKSKE